MNANDFLKGSEFIKKEDLEKVGEQTYTIHDVDVAEFGDAKKGTTDRLRAAQAVVAAAVERLRARDVTDEEIRRLFEAELAGVTKAGGRSG